ncbi:conserved hypothetical protein [Coccidioides posadasii str. Silveira]|uniref:Uncharacterized protein n=1 Tax=Coccidioides posadasii (strain RMSCC 757 / Silveira) TaxID=443226 RepID=E9D767_COCPS|nr:conserved hypothetical protein [Coccidioides posadasii str. Silveira]
MDLAHIAWPRTDGWEWFTKVSADSAKRISFPARVNNGLAGISDTLGFAFLCKLPPARTDFPYRALYATRLLNILLTPPRTSMLPASSPFVNREAASRILDRGMRYSSQGGPTKNEMAACKGLVATRIWGWRELIAIFSRRRGASARTRSERSPDMLMYTGV